MSMTRVTVLVLLYMVCGATGDLMLSYGMKQDPTAYQWVAAGTAVLGIGYGIMLGLLKDVPLSVVVPAGAGSYLLIAALSRVVLNEAVPPLRWAGTILVSCGVAMVMISDWQTRRQTATLALEHAEGELRGLDAPQGERFPTGGRSGEAVPVPVGSRVSR
jgi:drug/metabolite transporter (DMT)-like permease